MFFFGGGSLFVLEGLEVAPASSRLLVPRATLETRLLWPEEEDEEGEEEEATAATLRTQKDGDGANVPCNCVLLRDITIEPVRECRNDMDASISRDTQYLPNGTLNPRLITSRAHEANFPRVQECSKPLQISETLLKFLNCKTLRHQNSTNLKNIIPTHRSCKMLEKDSSTKIIT